MDHAIAFTGAYEPSALHTLIPGHWYIGFACEACGQRFAILNDPTQSGGVELSGAATFQTMCPNCNAARAYSAADLKPFQAAQGGPTSTA